MCCTWVFKKILFQLIFIGESLLCNGALVPTVPQGESVTCVHRHLFPLTVTPSSLSTRFFRNLQYCSLSSLSGSHPLIFDLCSVFQSSLLAQQTSLSQYFSVLVNTSCSALDYKFPKSRGHLCSKFPGHSPGPGTVQDT